MFSCCWPDAVGTQSDIDIEPPKDLGALQPNLTKIGGCGASESSTLTSLPDELAALQSAAEINTEADDDCSAVVAADRITEDDAQYNGAATNVSGVAANCGGGTAATGAKAKSYAAFNTGKSGAWASFAYHRAATSFTDGGAATSTGKSGASASVADCGAATSTGNCGAWASFAYHRSATSLADCGAATTTGKSGASASFSNGRNATSTGKSGASASFSNSSNATSTGKSGASASFANGGAATSTGKSGANGSPGAKSVSLGAMVANAAVTGQFGKNAPKEVEQEDRYVNGKKVIRATEVKYNPNKHKLFALPSTAKNADGLLTRLPTRMLDKIDDNSQKAIVVACDFARAKVAADPRFDKEVSCRDRAMLLFCLLKAVELEVKGKKDTAALVAAHVAANSEGNPTFATPQVRDSAKKLVFISKSYYKPALEFLKSVGDEDLPPRAVDLKKQRSIALFGENPPQTAQEAAEDIKQKARNSFGEKPSNHQMRMEWLEEVLKKWQWSTCRSIAEADTPAYSKRIESLVDSFDDCRRGGIGFTTISNAIEAEISCE